MRAHRALAIIIALAGCDSAPGESPGNGGMTVLASTSGALPDPDGYVVTLDGEPGPALGVNAEWSSGELAPGSYTVRLTGIADNCTSVDNPRTVTVGSGASATTTFVVTCTASVRVRTETSGIDLDDTYLLSIGNITPFRIGASGSYVVQSTVGGTLRLKVADIAANCVPHPANPATVSLVEATTDVTLRFSCMTATDTTGTVVVRLLVTSWGNECDVMSVSLDDESRPLIREIETSFIAVPRGSHVLALSGLSERCRVQGDSVKTVTVTALRTTDVTFTVHAPGP